MKKVAILTTFFDISTFSLTTVTTTQIRMLLDHDYDPRVLVASGTYRETEKGEPLPPSPFEEVPPPSVWNRQTLDLRPVFPALKMTGGVAPDFEDRVSKIVAVMEENLTDVDVAITHEFLLQKTHKEFNVAMRRYAKIRPDLLWLHWIHSCPTGVDSVPEYPRDCRYTTPPGYIVYPNDFDKPRVCSVYNLQNQEWRVRVNRASHSIDPLTLRPYDGLTKDLVAKADLLSGEVVAIYPVRLDAGKQPEKIIRLLKGVKRAGFEPRLLIVDWQSAGAHFQKYIDQLLALAKSLHMEHCVNFSSRLNDTCSQGVPRHVVQELMSLSNVYIHPSRSETYSLVVHEAIAAGNLVVLNHHLPVMRELFGDNAIYMDFGSDSSGPITYTPSEQAFWNDEALRLVVEIEQNRVLVAKTLTQREWSPSAMWRDFEPLFHLMPVGE